MRNFNPINLGSSNTVVDIDNNPIQVKKDED
jgi:hypothetical protein